VYIVNHALKIGVTRVCLYFISGHSIQLACMSVSWHATCVYHNILDCPKCYPA